MTIELVIDEHCFSLKTLVQMKNKLTHDFTDSEIRITHFSRDSQRLKKLGINILPAWLINNKVLRINPFDYGSLYEEILQIRTRSYCRKL